mmetsp:Transcript_7802/g.12482  ORF Transcript_7802/g.12482 Transcript_7802/m.12482 type:complete len:102 (-) Transcript_7802:321-626(-)
MTWSEAKHMSASQTGHSDFPEIGQCQMQSVCQGYAYIVWKARLRTPKERLRTERAFQGGHQDLGCPSPSPPLPSLGLAFTLYLLHLLPSMQLKPTSIVSFL